jgi:hypothetical protein
MSLTSSVLSGCMLGQRPRFGQHSTATGTMTGEVAIDAVLTRLDRVANAVFSADYNAVLNYGGVRSDVHTTQSSQSRRSTTIGDIRYIIDATGQRSCVVSTATCTSEINAALVSDTGVTPDFIFGDVAKRLRRDAAARISTPVASTLRVGSQNATCVDVPVTNGTKGYCVLDNGVLARFNGGDVTVDLVVYRETVDESAFSV